MAFAVVAGFALGIIAGFYGACYGIKAGIREGRWERQHMERLVKMWRGPHGETW
jgi:ABC-type dipeptide/oligopeptide/nickel transport system permease subunit